VHRLWPDPPPPGSGVPALSQLGLGEKKQKRYVDVVARYAEVWQEAIDAAENEGYKVVAVVSLVDREEGGSDAFRKKYKYFSVFTASELLANASAQTASQK